MNLKKILSRSLLALALGACGAAFAGPTYHVTIDTSTLGSGTAFLDLGLGALENAAPVSATLSGFHGMFGEYSELDGDAGGSVGGAVTLVNDASYSELYQGILLGGLFSFDVAFDGNLAGAANPTGTTFSATLYNGAQDGYLGLQGPLATIDLIPGQADMVSPANAYAGVTISAVSAVPEPSTALSMVTGLGLLGFGLRRRAR
jgi:hypothetical protein